VLISIRHREAAAADNKQQATKHTTKLTLRFDQYHQPSTMAIVSPHHLMVLLDWVFFDTESILGALMRKANRPRWKQIQH
jgi:hypothetical protein